jgi:hypothetical protein
LLEHSGNEFEGFVPAGGVGFDLHHNSDGHRNESTDHANQSLGTYPRDLDRLLYTLAVSTGPHGTLLTKGIQENPSAGEEAMRIRRGALDQNDLVGFGALMDHIDEHGLAPGAFQPNGFTARLRDRINRFVEKNVHRMSRRNRPVLRAKDRKKILRESDSRYREKQNAATPDEIAGKLVDVLKSLGGTSNKAGIHKRLKFKGPTLDAAATHAEGRGHITVEQKPAHPNGSGPKTTWYTLRKKLSRILNARKTPQPEITDADFGGGDEGCYGPNIERKVGVATLSFRSTPRGTIELASTCCSDDWIQTIL